MDYQVPGAQHPASALAAQAVSVNCAAAPHRHCHCHRSSAAPPAGDAPGFGFPVVTNSFSSRCTAVVVVDAAGPEALAAGAAACHCCCMRPPSAATSPAAAWMPAFTCWEPASTTRFTSPRTLLASASEQRLSAQASARRKRKGAQHIVIASDLVAIARALVRV